MILAIDDDVLGLIILTFFTIHSKFLIILDNLNPKLIPIIIALNIYISQYNTMQSNWQTMLHLFLILLIFNFDLLTSIKIFDFKFEGLLFCIGIAFIFLLFDDLVGEIELIFVFLEYFVAVWGLLRHFDLVL